MNWFSHLTDRIGHRHFSGSGGGSRRGLAVMECIVSMALLVVAISIVTVIVVRIHIDRRAARQEMVSHLVLDHAIADWDAKQNGPTWNRDECELPEWAVPYLAGATLRYESIPSDLEGLICVRCVLRWRDSQSPVSYVATRTHWRRAGGESDD